MSRFFKKDPDETQDYSIDWDAALDSAESISSTVWTVPSGITEVSDSVSDNITTVRLSGGIVATSYTVSCKITLDSGRILERSIYIRVDER